MKKTVMLGMSGGVDSSVAAALLLNQGYEVIGVTMLLLPDIKSEKSDGMCSVQSAAEDARKVADKLNIPHHIIDFKETFKTEVIDYFSAEYIKGRTPNPCIACNKFVKFGALLDKADAMGIDYIATGHYAKISYDLQTDKYLLKKSATTEKDQTYALYTLSQKQLSRILMPAGAFTKDQIRAIANDLDLSVAAKPDSQEICFVCDNDYSNYIIKNFSYVPTVGNFVDTAGNIIGKHKGILYYTVGQRKGLGITFGKPMFVVSIDAADNTVVLGEGSDVFSKELTASNVNFIPIDKLDSLIEVKAKIRYSAKESPAIVYPLTRNRIRVVFTEPQRAVTPGQSVVLYQDDVVIGGGIID